MTQNDAGKPFRIAVHRVTFHWASSFQLPASSFKYQVISWIMQAGIEHL
jgi:hypothetical protein